MPIMRFLPATMLAALCAAPVAAADLNGVDDSDDRHLAITLNYAEPDSLRRVDGQGLGASFIYGFGLTRDWLLEARLTGLVLERGDAGDTDFYQQDIGVDAIYRFRDAAGWQPFLLGGLSVIRNDVDLSELDDVGMGVSLGGGVVSPPLGEMDLRFRADVRYVHDDFLDGVQDVRLGFGLQIPLGGRGRGGQDVAPRGQDSDGDGVGDRLDRCPHSLPYVKHDSSGCMQPNQTVRLYEVTFDNGTSILTAGARAELADVVLALRNQPRLYVRIDGHTDSWGDAGTNRRLSLERAEAVATYLTLQGVPAQRLSVRGFGESRPVESNATAAGRERNRRIELVLKEAPAH